MDPTEPKIDERCYDTAVRLISGKRQFFHFGHIDTCSNCAFLIAALDETREVNRFGRNDEHHSISLCRGAVLVFLPGMAEIDEMHKCLMVTSDGLKPR